MPGKTIKAKNVRIPTVDQKGHKYAKYETYELDLADDFIQILNDPGDDFQLASVDSFDLPTLEKQQTEYWAFQHLKARLPLTYTPALIEGSAHDHVVNGQKWQMKTAKFLASTNRYQVTLQKSGGRIPGSTKRMKTQYEENDFQWLCIQMPPESNSAYLIPTSVLLERRYLGRLACTTGTIHLYPHRPAHPKTRWIEAYKIDLSTHQTAIRDYRKITGRY